MVTKRAKKRGVRKDPEGGLTAAGREYFARKEGAHLKPGVKGPADTPVKQKRKGSFLRRHYANLRGPLEDPKGEPTRLALAAHAWGEAVPRTRAAAARLARKGKALLERYSAGKKAGVAAKKTSAAKKTRTAKKTRKTARRTRRGSKV